MPDKPQTTDLERVLAHLEKGWQELAEFLRSQSQPQGRIIEANKFVLRDAEGNPRGELSVNPDGSSGLILIDKEGRFRAWLGLKEDGSAYLSLKDHLGRICFEVPGGPRPQSVSEEALPSHFREPLAGAAPQALEAQALMERLDKVGEDLAGLRELLIERTQPERRMGEAREPLTLGVEGETVPEINGSVLVGLEKLERSNRRLKLAGAFFSMLLIIALASLAFLMGQVQWRDGRPDGLIEANTLVIRGQGGISRAWLGEKDGTVLLNLLDKAGKFRASMALGADGEPSLRLYDKGQKLRAELGLSADGEPGVNLLDQNGILRAALGSPRLELGKAEPAGLLPFSSLVLFNEDGNPIWQAPRRWRR